MPFGRTNPCLSWFASPLFQAGVVAICFLLSALHAQAQISAQMLDMANLVFEATLKRVNGGTFFNSHSDHLYAKALLVSPHPHQLLVVAHA